MTDSAAPGPPVPALDADELGAWLHLLLSPGVGREAARRLLARLGTPQAVLDAPIRVLGECVDAPTALALTRPPDGHAYIDAVQRRATKD